MIFWIVATKLLAWLFLYAYLRMEKEDWALWHDPEFLETVHVSWEKGIQKYEGVHPREWFERYDYDLQPEWP